MAALLVANKLHAHTQTICSWATVLLINRIHTLQLERKHSRK